VRVAQALSTFLNYSFWVFITLAGAIYDSGLIGQFLGSSAGIAMDPRVTTISVILGVMVDYRLFLPVTAVVTALFVFYEVARLEEVYISMGLAPSDELLWIEALNVGLVVITISHLSNLLFRFLSASSER